MSDNDSIIPTSEVLETRALETRVVHSGEIEPKIRGAIIVPIFQSSTYASSKEADYHSIPYLRLNNSPNHDALHAKLADLEGGEDALVAASGMAAITTTLLAVLHAGDHLLVQNGLYGGTHTFITHDLLDFGISYDFVDLNNPNDWLDKLKENTRGFYVESLTNPLLKVGDLPAVTAFCRQHGLVSMVDNTLPSPVNCNPLELGFDIVLHSCTKYLNGHSDIVAGAVVASRDWIEKIKHKLNHLGGTLDPHACFLLHRGIKTLSLRVERQNANTQALAEYLEGHPKIGQVNYSGLPSHPNHARASQLFKGHGGLLSFDHAEGAAGAHAMIDQLRLPIEAVSLGGVESLVTVAAESTHVGLTDAERAELGIGPGLIRLAVGIEGITDLIQDFQQALK